MPIQLEFAEVKDHNTGDDIRIIERHLSPKPRKKKRRSGFLRDSIDPSSFLNRNIIL